MIQHIFKQLKIKLIEGTCEKAKTNIKKNKNSVIVGIVFCFNLPVLFNKYKVCLYIFLCKLHYFQVVGNIAYKNGLAYKSVSFLLFFWA